MGSGRRNRWSQGGRRTAASLAVFLTAAFAFLYLAGFTGSASLEELASPDDASRFSLNPDYSTKPFFEAGDAPKFRYPDKTGDKYDQVFLASGQMASVRLDKETGVPAFLTGAIPTPAGAGHLQAAAAFFKANIGLYRMSDPEGEFVVKREISDELGTTHLHMDQYYRGVPVFAAAMAVHFSAKGQITAVNGRYVPDIELDVKPAISVDEAIEIARDDLGHAAPSPDREPPLLTVLAPAGEPRRLTWKVTLAADEPPLRMVYFVDAHNGEVATSYDNLQDAKNRRTYSASNGTRLPGTLLIAEGSTSDDTIARNAHDNAGTTYDYYYDTFGRDSFNDSGAAITTTVNYGSSYNNAFWNGYQMVYGDGDGYIFDPLGNALDIVAHEFTHGVTQHTAGLIYSHQSGALNESFSDVFGVMVQRTNWLMGEDVFRPGTSGNALRSLSNPPEFGQPDHMNSYVQTSSDNGGVHVNSGIPNKAAYNVAQAIGRDKTEQIWYRALTLYLNATSQFADARDASVLAAADLFGESSPEVAAVENGFEAVGIGSTAGSETTARVEIDHTYRGDLVVTLGVGNPDDPVWSTVISNRVGGSAGNIYTTVDISGGAGYLPPDWQNRWYLKVYDAAGYDEGTISKFSISDHGTTYTATNVPVPIHDYETSVTYIPTFDDTPPAVTSTTPASGATAYASSHITAVFSKDMSASTINADSFTLRASGDTEAVPAAVSYDPGARTARLDPGSDLDYSTVYEATIGGDVVDTAGNTMDESHTWSFITMPPPKNYYFTWYDQLSPGMRDWLVMGNPATGNSNTAFDLFVGGQRANGSQVTVRPNQSLPVSFPGKIGGPVRMSALDGDSAIVSKRTLFGNSFKEVNGLEEGRLASRYFFTWYDSQSPGARNWVLIANPGTSTVEADIYIAGRKMNQGPYGIVPGTSVTPEFPGVIGGPVEVVAYEPGNPSSPREVIATQRVLWNGNFNEAIGIPADDLGSDYLFTWYDQSSPGARTWILVGNPDPSQPLAVEISLGGDKMINSATGDQYFLVPPGGSLTPSFPGVLNGPVEIRGYDPASFNPASPGEANMNFYTSQRTLFGNSFGEIAGIPRDRLAPRYFFSWYDQVSPGSTNWVLVANPGDETIVAEIWIAGRKVRVLKIAPGETRTPTFPGVMNGPVEVRGYDAGSYNSGNPGAPDREVFTSQRVIWNGHFNEVEGINLF